jgi:hypothetical protein
VRRIARFQAKESQLNELDARIKASRQLVQSGAYATHMRGVTLRERRMMVKRCMHAGVGAVSDGAERSAAQEAAGPAGGAEPEPEPRTDPRPPVGEGSGSSAVCAAAVGHRVPHALPQVKELNADIQRAEAKKKAMEDELEALQARARTHAHARACACPHPSADRWRGHLTRFDGWQEDLREKEGRMQELKASCAVLASFVRR